MIFEIKKVLEEGFEEDKVEYFDDGSYQVCDEILQKIYVKGYLEGKELSQKNGKVKA